MATVKIRSGFGQLLRESLDAKGITLRELARRLSEAEQVEVESKRRLLHRYIDGLVQPSEKARHQIAKALDLPTDTFDENAQELAEIQALIAALEPLAQVLHKLAIKARERGAA